jgi:hypothetical protein
MNPTGKLLQFALEISFKFFNSQSEIRVLNIFKRYGWWLGNKIEDYIRYHFIVSRDAESPEISFQPGKVLH